ncbi:catechol 2,3-dioxygenase-like lactoylglutathione lyase family enzyme [Actimicrobium sp. GrIS 1.19]|nr:catechol 2,3-dioxygenase-like lactoylglutathione lyase family enzyme [Actimicrobium sp. GrIS 1.19]
MNLNQVTLETSDVTESISFYRRLGFIQIVNSPQYARFACPDGDATSSVHRAAGPAVSS